MQRWLRQVEGLERQFAQVSALLFDAARLQPGEAVLDVGCGTGTTTRMAASAVGSGGAVTGLDVSADMLEAAADDAAEAAADDAAGSEGGGTLEWLEADVVTWQPQRTWDVVISRFGVMFFGDPAAAFATLARAMRPGGRLCVAVWSRRDLSPLFEVPLRAALEVLPATALPPVDGGPFSLSDSAAVAHLLTRAGWSDVAIAEHTLLLPFLGGLKVAEAAVAALDFGPLRTVTADLAEADLPRVVDAVRETLARHLDGGGLVQLRASVQIITTRRAS